MAYRSGAWLEEPHGRSQKLQGEKRMSQDFNWLSPLGISVALFLLYGAVYVLIGAFTPVMADSDIGRRTLVISNRTDRIVFGDSPENLLRNDPALTKLRTTIFNMLAGMLVAAGILVIAVAWFGLRQKQAWALGALALAGIAVLPFWWLVFRPYFQAGAPVGFFDIPPFMWVPGVLLIPAVVLGWIGLQ